MVVAQGEGAWPETVIVSSGSESTDILTLEELVLCNRPQESGGSVQEQGQTPV